MRVCSSHTLPERHNCASIRSVNNTGSTSRGRSGPHSESRTNLIVTLLSQWVRGSIRTYGTTEAVENLDSSPPVETKSDGEINDELDTVRRRTRVRAALRRVTSPIRRLGRCTKSTFSRRRTRTYGSKNRNRRKVLLALGSASLLRTGWLSAHKDSTSKRPLRT